MLKGTFVLIKEKPKTNKSLSEAVAGDLLCYNNDKLYIYPSSKFEGTPIGVVVIPTSHDVYGNGSCGVLSLVNMSCQTPDTGTTANETITYGGYGLVPADVCDITLVDGSINSEILVNKSNKIPTWKTDETISNDGFPETETVMSFPAACCCWRYHTLGTKQGDWYLPSVIELKRINTVLAELQNTYETIPEQLVPFNNKDHWSCIGERGGECAYHVVLGQENKKEVFDMSDGNYTVRAFMQAGPDIVSE